MTVIIFEDQQIENDEEFTLIIEETGDTALVIIDNDDGIYKHICH